MSTNLWCITCIPALPPCCLHSIQSYLFIILCPNKHHSFSHTASALSDNWAGSDRDLLSLPRAGWTPHCLCGDEDPPDSLEAGIPGPCTSLQCSFLGKPQHQRCPKPFQDSNVPTAGVQHVAKILVCSQGTGIAFTCQALWPSQLSSGKLSPSPRHSA